VKARDIYSFNGLIPLLFAVTTLVPRPLMAATVSLRPIADTTLQEAFPTYNFGDGTTFTAGGRPRGGRTRALIQFDVAGSIPTAATINSVTLSLSVVGVPSAPVNSIFDLNRLLASWGEGNGADRGGTPAGPGQATWNNRFGTSGLAWTNAGGDFSSAISGSRSISGLGSYTFASTALMISDVQGWLNNASSNFGWLLRSESELTGYTIRRFGSRSDPSNTPILTVTYTPVPEPAALSLLVFGLAALGWRGPRTRPA